MNYVTFKRHLDWKGLKWRWAKWDAQNTNLIVVDKIGQRACSKNINGCELAEMVVLIFILQDLEFIG